MTNLNIKSLLLSVPFVRYLNERFVLPIRRHRSECQKLTQWDLQDEIWKDFYSEFIKPGDLVFDVGCNVGNRAKIFLRLGAKVIGFEPQPGCRALLRCAYGRNSSFTIDSRAMGSAPGKAEMMLSESNVLSTLSREWIAQTTNSGRFDSNLWTRRITVDVGTLEGAIRQYGQPSFIKIDTEGYELDVVRGLNCSIQTISFEFAVENCNATDLVIKHLVNLGMNEFQISIGESGVFLLDSWARADRLRNELARLAECDNLTWGDIYARKARDDG